MTLTDDPHALNPVSPAPSLELGPGSTSRLLTGQAPTDKPDRLNLGPSSPHGDLGPIDLNYPPAPSSLSSSSRLHSWSPSNFLLALTEGTEPLNPGPSSLHGNTDLNPTSCQGQD